MQADEKSSPHVLVVDDNPTKRYVIVQILRAGGFAVTEASCGADALTLAKNQPDVIVLDVELPDIGGFEVCRRIKAEPATSRIPVLHISGKFVSGNDKADGLEGGADGYLIEPVEPRELRAAVAAMLRIRNAEASLVRANKELQEEVAERKRAEQALRDSEARAEVANRTKSEFLANMSHEIRTPMTAIIGFIELLADPDLSSDDRANHIAVIRQNAEHLLGIINDILDLSKIEAGALVVERIVCSPTQIVSEVASFIRMKAKDKALSFTITSEGAIPETIQSDPTRLRQILLNLCGNAVKFTQHGRVQLVMRLENSRIGCDERLAFDTIDSGIGMDPEQLSRLFQPFSQADISTTRKFGGTGLGLAVSRKLARALGGDINVQSASGIGSKFTLSITTGPLMGVKMLDQFVESIQHEQQAKANETPSRLAGRILLADDGVHNQYLLSAYLRKAGAEVTVVSNGVEAYEAAMKAVESGQPYDLIVMDMQMPELDGYGATAKLRSSGYRSPILALTANAMVEDRQKCLGNGCTDYLAKPVRRSDLIRMVGKYLPQADPSAQTPAEVDGSAERSATHDELPGLADEIARENAEDEDLRKFLPLFIASLPEQVQRLEQSLVASDLGPLRDLVHQLRGTGGLYGFARISHLAARSEEMILAEQSLEEIRGSIRELIETVRNVGGYELQKEHRQATESATSYVPNGPLPK